MHVCFRNVASNNHPYFKSIHCPFTRRMSDENKNYRKYKKNNKKNEMNKKKVKERIEK